MSETGSRDSRPPGVTGPSTTPEAARKPLPGGTSLPGKEGRPGASPGEASSASLPRGAARPPGPVPGPARRGGKAAPSSRVSYQKMYRWGWHMIMFAPFIFLISRFMLLLQALLGPVTASIFSSTLALLGGGQVKGWTALLFQDNKMTAVIVFLAAGAASILVAFLAKILMTLNDNTMNRRLRQDLHDKLLTLGPTYHNRHDLGENMTIVMQFSTGANMILSEIYSTPFIRVVVIGVTTGLMAEQFAALKNFPLTLQLILLIVLLAIPVIGYWLSSRLKEAYLIVRDSQVAMSNEFTNSLLLPLEVQLMGAQAQRSRSFGAKVSRYFRDQFKAAVKNDLASQFRNSSTLLLQVIFVFSAAYYSLKSPDPVQAAKMVGIILSSYLLIPYVVGPIQEIITFLNGINVSWPQVEKVVEVLEARPDVEEKPRAVDLKGDDFNVHFQNVSFSYIPGGPRILDHLSHTFEERRITAVVSIAGGGKSTIANLIARLRDPDEGAILIGSQDLRALTFKSLRANVVKVSQFPLFISASIRENMLLAKPDASDTELEAVCRQTGMWEILGSACGPGGHPLDYHLPADISQGLSGGQRKLLALTRALLLKPRILITDEITTGMDNLLKQLVARFLLTAAGQATVILVEHDMKFIEQVASQVCCLEKGKFTAIGSPAELLARPTLYQRLYEAEGAAEEGTAENQSADRGEGS